MNQTLKTTLEQNDEGSGLRRIPAESRNQVAELIDTYDIHEIQSTLSDLFYDDGSQSLAKENTVISSYPAIIDKLIRSDAEKGFDLEVLDWIEEASYPLVDPNENTVYAYAHVKRNGQGFLSSRIEYPEVGSA
jgi:hypothetical protein